MEGGRWKVKREFKIKCGIKAGQSTNDTADYISFLLLTSDSCTTSLASVCRASVEFEAGSFLSVASSAFEASPGGLQTKYFKFVSGDSLICFRCLQPFGFGQILPELQLLAQVDDLLPKAGRLLQGLAKLVLAQHHLQVLFLNEDSVVNNSTFKALK